MNYINRPNHAGKRNATEIQRKDKQPPLFHLNTDDVVESEHCEEEQVHRKFDDNVTEQNFMEGDPRAYFTLNLLPEITKS